MYPPDLPQILSIYSVVIAVVLQYDCIGKGLTLTDKRFSSITFDRDNILN